MKQLKKLNRAEMKSISGGDFPTCTIGCYDSSGDVVPVTVINYPVGTGCSHAPLNDYCPEGYKNYTTCTCQSGGS